MQRLEKIGALHKTIGGTDSASAADFGASKVVSAVHGTPEEATDIIEAGREVVDKEESSFIPNYSSSDGSDNDDHDYDDYDDDDDDSNGVDENVLLVTESKEDALLGGVDI